MKDRGISKGGYRRSMPPARLVAGLLALITLVVYLPVRSHDFVYYDDQDYLTNNPIVQNGLTWSGIKWAFTTWHASNWHPLTWLSHMLDCQLFGLNPGPQHLVNVLFHSANTVLLFILLLVLTNDLWPSAVVAALFGWHPLHVESVAWLAERKDVLSTFFAFLSLLAYTRFAQGRSSDKGRTKPALNYLLALTWFGLGLMSKPMLVTLPFVFLLLDFWPLRRISIPDFRFPIFGRLVLEKWPFFVMTVFSCTVTVLAQNHGKAIVPLEHVSLGYRLANIPLAYGLYLLKTIWPARLAVLYPLPEGISGLEVTTCVMVLIPLSVTVWLMRKRSPYLLVGWLWFLGTLVPVIGLVEVGSQALADRYTYFPLVGIFIAVVFGLRDWVNHLQFPQSTMAVVFVPVLAGCIMVTEVQLTYWRNTMTLFAHAIAVTENNTIAHLGIAHELQGEGKLNEALAEYRVAERLSPNILYTHYTIGGLLADMNEPDKALAEYNQAAQIDPNVSAVHDSAGIVLVQLGHYAEAFGEFKKAAQLDPSDPWPHYYMAKALAGQGRDVAAVAEFREALRIAPDNSEILTFASELLSTSGDSEARDGPMALAFALRANDLTGHTQASVFDVLGMACAETGHFDEAQQAVQKAMDLAVAAKVDNLQPLQQRLDLYKIHKPWRQSFLSTNNPAQDILRP
ncbi:MAG TPA: tetratricopeptide repeat protein [Verrucomicrobiae bacterium]|nr:tetratricopeptide repeat protein [Verrucomicrobiae bacterium]